MFNRLRTCRARRTILALGALTTITGLGGCGFTPMYANPGVSRGLSAIHIEPPQGRVAFLIRQNLEDGLGGTSSVSPKWRLTYTVQETRDPRGLRIDNVAERYAVSLSVQYRLVDTATGRLATAGDVSSQVSYDAADAPYAGIAARQDSQARAAADVARRIQLQLSAWFAKGAGG